jgi:hypothetical protein
MSFVYDFSGEVAVHSVSDLIQDLPARKHVAADVEEAATFEAQQDWEEAVGPKLDFMGCMGSEHNFISLTLPECLPQRLAIVSYACEFAYLNDVTHNHLFLVPVIVSNKILTACGALVADLTNVASMTKLPTPEGPRDL